MTVGQPLTGPVGGVNSLQFSPRTDTLASGGGTDSGVVTQSMQFWALGTGQVTNRICAATAGNLTLHSGNYTSQITPMIRHVAVTGPGHELELVSAA